LSDKSHRNPNAQICSKLQFFCTALLGDADTTPAFRLLIWQAKMVVMFLEVGLVFAPALVEGVAEPVPNPVYKIFCHRFPRLLFV
jgi:hypothetical protein